MFRRWKAALQVAPDRFRFQRRDARLEAADLVGEIAVGQFAQPFGFGIQLCDHAVGLLFKEKGGSL